jgi:hypothetical protein
MERDAPDAGFMDGLTGTNRKRVIQFAARHGIPFMYEGDFIVRDRWSFEREIARICSMQNLVE